MEIADEELNKTEEKQLSDLKQKYKLQLDTNDLNLEFIENLKEQLKSAIEMVDEVEIKNDELISKGINLKK